MPSLLTARWVLGLAQIKQGKMTAGQKNCKIAALSNQVVPVEIQKVLQTLGMEQEWLKEVNVVFSGSAKSKSGKWRSLTRSGLAFFLSIVILSAAFFMLVAYVSSRVVEGEFGVPLTTVLLTIFPESPG